MTGDFNIWDRDWNLSYSFYLAHSEILFNIADALDLLFSHSTNLAPTRYSDNSENSNSVIDLMFLRPNSVELDNYLILPELWFSSNHTPLVVNIQIIEEFIPIMRRTIIKNNKEK